MQIQSVVRAMQEAARPGGARLGGCWQENEAEVEEEDEVEAGHGVGEMREELVWLGE